jgi:predicted MFS family arabinose efflux permease
VSYAQVSQSRPGIAPGVQRPAVVLAFLCIAQFMVFLDVSIVNVALPSIGRGLRIAEGNLPYVVTLYGTVLGGFLLLGSRLADSFGRRRPFDLPGAAALTAGLLALIYGLDAAISRGWRSGAVIASLVAAVVLLAAFAVAERRAEAPLVPFDVFRSRTLRYANLATLFLLAAVVTIFFFASLFIQQVLGYSPLQTGLGYVPLAVMVAVGAGIASNAIARVPAKAILALGLLLVAGGLIMLARTTADASYPAQILPVFVAIGLGMGLSFVPLQIAAQADVSEERAGLAAGLINTSQEVGGALGVAIAATFAFRRVASLTSAAHGNPHLVAAARTTVFHDGFAAGAAFAVIALLLSVFLLPRW